MGLGGEGAGSLGSAADGVEMGKAELAGGNPGWPRPCGPPSLRRRILSCKGRPGGGKMESPERGKRGKCWPGGRDASGLFVWGNERRKKGQVGKALARWGVPRAGWRWEKWGLE